jgi:putative two-component system response regulator
MKRERSDPAASATSAKILVVDDQPKNLQLVGTMLRSKGYQVVPAQSGAEALVAAAKHHPDLVLLDVMMPVMDGYEVCQRFKEDDALREIPILFVSALTETLDKVKAFEVGGVDYITKPFELEEVYARVETHLQLRRLQIELEKHNRRLEALVEEKVREISDSQMATIFALAKLAEARDLATGQHIERVQLFCRLVAEKLSARPRYAQSINATYVQNIFQASPLHDIGKVGIDDDILRKPGKLTEDEFRTMKTHTTIGALTLEMVRAKYPRNAFINMGIAIARSHHERWDGSGYPNGLAGEDIPLSARIMTLADVYDALTSKRSYKTALTHEYAREFIGESSGSHLDPTVVDVFLEIEDEFNKIREAMQD